MVYLLRPFKVRKSRRRKGILTLILYERGILLDKLPMKLAAAQSKLSRCEQKEKYVLETPSISYIFPRFQCSVDYLKI